MNRAMRMSLAALACLPAAAISADASAQAPNLVIISSDPSWTSAFTPLTAWLEGSDYDHEGGRFWRCEIAVRSDSSSVKEYLAERWSALQQEDGGDLFAVVVVDPSHVSHPVARMIRDPEVAGESIGWGAYVATYDNLADMTGDGYVDVITFLLPAQSRSDCEMAVETALQHLWNQAWLVRGPQAGEAGRAVDRHSPHHFNRILFLVEDHDRQGRPGALVRAHAMEVQDRWHFADFVTTYQGDEWPYNYQLREARADHLDNLGHQIKFIFGTENNRVNVANFQDQRESPPWSVDHLHPAFRYSLHVSMTCAHHAIHRPDNYGRPHAEQVLFLGNRGAFASLGMTAQIRQWPAFLLAETLTESFRARILAHPHGATVGRAWRDAKNAFRQAYQPRHSSECMSFCGLGWPFIRIVPGPGPVASAPRPASRTGRLEVVPSPFVASVAIRYSERGSAGTQVSVFDVAGRRIRSLQSEAHRDTGTHDVVWDGRDDLGAMAPAGVYFVRVTAGGETHRAAVVRVR